MNTVILRSYSTLPRNGRIHELSEITGIYKVIGQIGFVRVGKIRRQKIEPAGSEELKPILKEPMSVVRRAYCVVCPTLTGPILRYAHLVPKGPESIRLKKLGHYVCDIIGCGYFLRPIFPEMTKSRMK